LIWPVEGPVEGSCFARLGNKNAYTLALEGARKWVRSALRTHTIALASHAPHKLVIARGDELEVARRFHENMEELIGELTLENRPLITPERIR
jgi:hypothetical protein